MLLDGLWLFTSSDAIQFIRDSVILKCISITTKYVLGSFMSVQCTVYYGLYSIYMSGLGPAIWFMVVCTIGLYSMLGIL